MLIIPGAPRDHLGRARLGGSGGGTSTNTVQQADPWSGQQPYLTQSFQNAQQLFYGGDGSFGKGTYQPQFYTGQAVASLDPATTQALDLQTTRALGGSPVTTAADGLLTNTMNGAYLNANPAMSSLGQLAGGQGPGGTTLDQLAASQGPGGTALGQLTSGQGLGGNTLGLLSSGQGFGEGTLNQLTSGQGLGGNTLNQLASGQGYGEAALGQLASGQGPGAPTLDQLASGQGLGSTTLANLANGQGPGADVLAGLAAGGYQDPGSATLTRAANGGLTNAADPMAAQLASGISMGPAVSLFGNEASGGMLGANPYNSAMVNAAAQPVIQNYMTAVAPGVDAQMERSGRYGSGAQQTAQSTAQQNLGNTLSNMSANLYGQDYANERNLQQQAQGQIENAYTQGAQRQLSATGLLGQYSAGDIGTQMAGAQDLSSNAARDRSQQMQAATSLGQLSMGAAEGLNQSALTAANSLDQSALSGASGLDQSALAGASGLDQSALSAAGSMNQSALSGANSLDQMALGGANGLGSLYNQGLGNQMQAASLAPAAANVDYTNINALGQVGQTMQDYNQALLNQQIQQWNFTQQQPYQLAQQYSGLINGHYGGTTTTSPSIMDTLSNPLLQQLF